MRSVSLSIILFEIYKNLFMSWIPYNAHNVETKYIRVIQKINAILGSNVLKIQNLTSEKSNTFQNET